MTDRKPNTDRRQPTATESAALFWGAADQDPESQRQLHQRYADRITRLVRSRLQQSVRSRFDAEDVVNSAFRSFFMRLSDGRFVLPDTGGLWPLLAQIAIHKLHRSTEFHLRQRRRASAEAAGGPDTSADNFDARDFHRFGGDDELILREELDWLAEKLPEAAMHAVRLSIEGYSHQEVADTLAVSDRTVRRYLSETRSLLRVRLDRLAPRQSEVTSTAETVRWDNYLLRRMVGDGRFGKVYLATEKSTLRDVAIKHLRKRWTRDAAVRAQFDREAEMMSRLAIDGVVETYGHGSTPREGRFIVMKWVDGGSLADSLAGTPEFDTAETIERFADLADTLEKVHDRGIVHRDVKPANVLVSPERRWLLTDFGFAVDSDSRQPNRSMGTPAYMAPEQIDPFFGPIGPWTDNYSWGVMLAQWLTGQTHFANRTADQAISMATQSDREDLVDAVTARHGHVLGKLVADSLKRKTRDRARTSEELATRLRKFSSDSLGPRR